MGTDRVGGPRRLLATAGIWLAAVAGVAAAGDVPEAPPRPEALTSLEAGTLSRSDAVVLARVKSVVPGKGGAPTLARATIERSLRGTATGEATVFVGGPRADDPKRPLEPWFAATTSASAGGRYVLFLRTSRAGSGWTLEALFSAEGDEGAEKIAVLEEEMRLAADADPVRRREATVAYLVGLVEAERPWSRLHGARELAWLAGAVPAALSEATLQAIEERRMRSFENGVRTALATALDRIEPGRSARPPAQRARTVETPTPTPPVAPAPPAPSSTPAAPAPATSAATPPAAPPAAAAAEVARLRHALEGAAPAARPDAMSALARAGKASVADDLVALLSDADPLVRERA